MQISLAGWSLNRRFRRQAEPLKLTDFPRVAVEEFGIDMVELNSPFFVYEEPASPATSGISAAYLGELKSAAEGAGCTILGIAVDGHGDLAATDPAERRQAVENHKKWFEVCSVLGARCFRANSGGRDRPDDPEALRACTESFAELAELGREHNIVVLMENHWGISQSPENMVHVIEQVGSPFCRLLADFLNWPEQTDKYAALARIAPYSYATHAKFLSFNQQGESNEIDAGRVMQIFRQAGYANPFGIEFEGPGDDHDGVLKSKALLQRHAY